MSCDIRSWGPSGWNLLHCVAAAYAAQPTEPQKANMLAFLHSLGKVLPCGSCGAHFTQGLREARLDSTAAAPLQSKQALFAWMVEQHNRVNRQRSKPRRPRQNAGGGHPPTRECVVVSHTKRFRSSVPCPTKPLLASKVRRLARCH